MGRPIPGGRSAATARRLSTYHWRSTEHRPIHVPSPQTLAQQHAGAATPELPCPPLGPRGKRPAPAGAAARLDVRERLLPVHGRRPAAGAAHHRARLARLRAERLCAGRSLLLFLLPPPPSPPPRPPSPT